ncbi:MAG: hypothetical protein COU08_01915 [Candidatus Harrisonbacteria bacterium CG10_big_fil_rev_8_21_14_0_10_42_17]|uniref:Transglutaminase-like domain-containing protein n=1 Tax=Candidatus Harrisonbacteria bacterium CG10_big_fil_rev_8_21_14_0_10_42_17 TaxID=1974584 RepID=A0A2M6WIF1_9BACT|nr:MAG: hypothetical protein COU08_01915 [Candidatus Harrisonbacteria bacterium CG10_big_fil_rev_8_21_14_0_10_42_17]
MPFFKRIKQRIHQTRERLGLRFFTHSQQYRARYHVYIRNEHSQQNPISLVIPTPPHSPTQEITTASSLTPAGFHRDIDPQFRNHYAVWRFNLKPHATLDIDQRFDVCVRPARHILSTRFSLNDYASLQKKYEPYLTPNTYIRLSTKVIKLAKHLAGDKKNLFHILSAINRYITKHIPYGNPITGLYSSEDALTLHRVDCGGFDILFVALCVALHIPARVVSGFFAGYDNNGMHAWAEVLLPDETWFPVDPSMEQRSHLGTTTRSGRFGFVGSDRVAFSYGTHIPLHINGAIHHAPILQHPFIVSPHGKTSVTLTTTFTTHSL